ATGRRPRGYSADNAPSAQDQRVGDVQIIEGNLPAVAGPLPVDRLTAGPRHLLEPWCLELDHQPQHRPVAPVDQRNRHTRFRLQPHRLDVRYRAANGVDMEMRGVLAQDRLDVPQPPEELCRLAVEM